VITVLSDTHGTDDHRLEGRTLAAVRTADLVLHAGDFTTAAVLDAFVAETGSERERTNGRETEPADSAGVGDGMEDGDGVGNGEGRGRRERERRRHRDDEKRFVAVAGNNDDAAVRERLDETGVVEGGGVRFLVVHGHRHDATALSLLGRQEDADVVVAGHSHRPEWDPSGAVAVLHPGSHADPRWHRPAHAELEPTTEGLSGRLVTPGGEVLEAFEFATGRV
jgi:putative phosphoesterase